MSATNKRNLSDKTETSFYKLVSADYYFSFFTSVIERLLTLYAKSAQSNVETWHDCHVCLLIMCYTLSIFVSIGCLLTQFHIRSSKDSLFIAHKLSVILHCVLQNRYYNFSQLCKQPAFHDVKVRGASVNSTSQFRVSAMFLLLNFSNGGVQQ